MNTLGPPVVIPVSSAPTIQKQNMKDRSNVFRVGPVPNQKKTALNARNVTRAKRVLVRMVSVVAAKRVDIVPAA